MPRKTDNSSRRVVVTGLGVVSSIGIGWQEFWKNLIAGKSGISKIESFDTSAYDWHYAGEVKNFEPDRFIDKRKLKYMGRASQLAVAASNLALKDAGISPANLPKDRTGVCIGTTMGEPQIMENLDRKCALEEKYSIDRLSAFKYPAGSLPGNVATELGLKGINILFSTACAAGNYSIGYCFDKIKSGNADFTLAGGADALSQIAFTGFSRLFAMAPEKCQPFDKNRKGMMLGEGGAVVVLETLGSALRRKAKIYAEVLGYGLSCDAHHMTNPSTDGIIKAIKRSILASGIKISEIDYISAHGTGTSENDKAECAALKIILAERLSAVPVSSIKSMLGHTLGAASAFEAIACCLAVKEHVIPPTINLEEQDLECEIDCVPNKGRQHVVDLALNNSSAFGGNNACVVLKSIK